MNRGARLHNKSASVSYLSDDKSPAAELEKRIPHALRSTLNSQLSHARKAVIRTPFPRFSQIKRHKQWNSISIPDEASVLLAEKRQQQEQFHTSLCQQVAIKSKLRLEAFAREQEWEKSMVQTWQWQEDEARRLQLSAKRRSKEERLALEKQRNQENLRKARQLEEEKAEDRKYMHALALRHYMEIQKQSLMRQQLRSTLQGDLRAAQQQRDAQWRQAQQDAVEDLRKQELLLQRLEDDELDRERKHGFSSHEATLQSPKAHLRFLRRKQVEKVASQHLYQAVLDGQVRERQARCKRDYELSRHSSLTDIKACTYLLSIRLSRESSSWPALSVRSSFPGLWRGGDIGRPSMLRSTSSSSESSPTSLFFTTR